MCFIFAKQVCAIWTTCAFGGFKQVLAKGHEFFYIAHEIIYTLASTLATLACGVFFNNYNNNKLILRFFRLL